MASVQVMESENGPYKVAGEIELIDHNGNVVDANGKTTVFLCRCGGSTNKPFCDVTHSKIGFPGSHGRRREGRMSCASTATAYFVWLYSGRFACGLIASPTPAR